jgi:phosphoglycerate dehydrogenase-like enzyme
MGDKVLVLVEPHPGASSFISSLTSVQQVMQQITNYLGNSSAYIRPVVYSLGKFKTGLG